MIPLPLIDPLISVVRNCARQILLPAFHNNVARIDSDTKSDQSIITEVDLAMQKALLQQLKSHWQIISFLGEEMPREEQLSTLADSRFGVWVVDPLDGTSNFSLGIPFYSVSVALIVDNQIEMGVVYDPVRDECFSAQRGCGAFLNAKPLNLADATQVNEIKTGLVDFKRLSPALASKLAVQPPYQSQRSFGSVALDWCWMAAARGDVYVHGNQNLWDYCAGHLVFEEAGGFSSTLQGEPVFNGSLDKRSAVLAINESIYQQWYEYLTSV